MEDEHKCRPLLVCLEGAGVVSVRARVEVAVLTEHALAPPETVHAVQQKNKDDLGPVKHREEISGKVAKIIMVTFYGGTWRTMHCRLCINCYATAGW